MKNPFKTAQRAYENQTPVESIDFESWADSLLERGEIDEEKHEWLLSEIEKHMSGKMTAEELEMSFKIPF